MPEGLYIDKRQFSTLYLQRRVRNRLVFTNNKASLQTTRELDKATSAIPLFQGRNETSQKKKRMDVTYLQKF